jgi:polyhydroxyalkanoate synthesis repressor PhaR
MIREGGEVEVRDARTGKDLTRAVLTQIVVEDARSPEGGLPTNVLHQLVMASDRATSEFLGWYLNSALDLLRKAQHGVQHGITDARRVVVNPLEFVRGVFSGGAESAPPESSDVERLRRRVEELQARVEELSQARKPAPRKHSS